MTGVGSDGVARGMALGTDGNGPRMTCGTIRGYSATGGGTRGGAGGALVGKVMVRGAPG